MLEVDKFRNIYAHLCAEKKSTGNLLTFHEKRTCLKNQGNIDAQNIDLCAMRKTFWDTQLAQKRVCHFCIGFKSKSRQKVSSWSWLRGGIFVGIPWRS